MREKLQKPYHPAFFDRLYICKVVPLYLAAVLILISVPNHITRTRTTQIACWCIYCRHFTVLARNNCGFCYLRNLQANTCYARKYTTSYASGSYCTKK